MCVIVDMFTKKIKFEEKRIKRDALGRAFDRAVSVAVSKGEHEEDAAARVIHSLIDGRKDIVRAVAAARIDGTSVVEDIIQSQVEIGRSEFERGNVFLLVALRTNTSHIHV